MFLNVQQVLEAGQAGKWFKPESEEVRKAILDSIPLVNLDRGSSPSKANHGRNLRYYERNGYLVIQDGPDGLHEIAQHPDDAKNAA